MAKDYRTHTPGPWHVGTNGGCAKDHAICAGPIVIAEVYGCGYPIGKGWSPGSAADARLIAEAPAMRDVLGMILHNQEPMGDGYTKVCTLDVEAAEVLLARIDAMKED